MDGNFFTLENMKHFLERLFTDISGVICWDYYILRAKFCGKIYTDESVSIQC
jgi:hypothetical protein